MNWVFRSSATIVMNNCIQVGLFVESINNTTTTSAQFDQVEVGGGSPQPLAAAPASSPNATEMGMEVSILPNPTSGELAIDLSTYAGRAVRLEVYSLEGRLIHQTGIDEAKDIEQLDLSTYESGMYLLKVQSEGKPVVLKRVVVSRR